MARTRNTLEALKASIQKACSAGKQPVPAAERAGPTWMHASPRSPCSPSKMAARLSAPATPCTPLASAQLRNSCSWLSESAAASGAERHSGAALLLSLLSQGCGVAVWQAGKGRGSGALRARGGRRGPA